MNNLDALEFMCLNTNEYTNNTDTNILL